MSSTVSGTMRCGMLREIIGARRATATIHSSETNAWAMFSFSSHRRPSGEDRVGAYRPGPTRSGGARGATRAGRVGTDAKAQGRRHTEAQATRRKASIRMPG
ncbi:hypothetical protein CHIBA101_0139 [Actinomyces sp. Chiba101]|nr:hypothetical protein CHIBA101_0139 [Actinomyces sp. Chiba101]